MFSEQDVDRELKAALSVSPSPGFEARVLQRVEADRPARGAQYGWFAAAASLLLAAGVFYPLNRPAPAAAPQVPAVEIVERAAPAPQVPAPQIVEHTAAAAVSPAAGIPDHARTAAPLRVTPVSTASRAARSAEPEVIVPVNQMEAVRRLVRAVNEGRLKPPVEPPQGPIAPPTQVSVAPVVVEPIPLTPLGGAGGK